MTNSEFIHLNREADIRSLALKKVPEGVDALWCMRQIEGYQLAKKKLPRWTVNESLWYPPRISMEQCSSEASAKYKAGIINRLLGEKKSSMADLTGGFGVDFSYMAQGFGKAVYIEQQKVLCQAAEHNMPLLGLPHAQIINTDAQTFIEESLSINNHFDIIFIDPARRDVAGRKTIAIEDCTPDITILQDKLKDLATYVVVKLSPMLDITQAKRRLKDIAEIHVVSIKGECKELLFVLSKQSSTTNKTSEESNENEEHDEYIENDENDEYKENNVNSQAPIIHCVNLATNDRDLTIKESKQANIEISYPEIGGYLFEPNASILKAGVQDAFAAHYSLKKLHPQSNLFICDCNNKAEDYKTSFEAISVTISARSFRIIDIYDFSKSELKRLRNNLHQANITIRNFPSSVQELRKRLKISEGGKDYLFITTLQERNKHIIIHCQHIQ